MAFVEFENVGKTYHMGEVHINALHDATFQVEQGELVVIVGPSGAGKTTLLNILGGMDTLSTGKVMLDGNEISSMNKKQLTEYRRHDVGFVFQFYCRRHSRGADHQSECAGSAYRFGNRADF